MSKQRAKGRSHASQARMVAAYLQYREDEILDAIVSAAALIARADGWVQDVEYSQLVDFLDRNDFLAIVARDDVLTQFERCVRELREPGGPSAAVDRLRRHRGGSTAPLIAELIADVAAADCRIDPREQHVMELIGAALGMPAPSAPMRHNARRSR